MSEPRAKMQFEVNAVRVDAHGSLALPQDNVRRYGTVFNTVAPGTRLSGTMRRGA